jgi:hypothetical protein
MGGVILAALLPCFVIAVYPAVAWDADTYHLTLPKLYLEHGGFRDVPFNVYSNWPLNVELLFTAGMLAKDYILATLVHFGFGLLTLYAIYVGGREFHCSAAGWVAAVLFLANKIVVDETVIAYVDVACAFFFLAGLLFMLRALDSGEDRKSALLMAGLCGGLLAGAKVTGFVGAALLGILYLVWLLLRRPSALRADLRVLLACFALPAFVLWVPWLIKAAWYTRNPVYPFLYQWFGGSDWSAALGSQFTAWQLSIGMGRTPVDYLLLPVRVILQGGQGFEHFDGTISAFWIVLLPVSLVFGLGNRFARRCLGAAGLYFIFWALTSQQIRFLIPVLPPLAIAAAVTLIDLVERIPWRRVRATALSLTLLAALGVLAYGHISYFQEGLELFRRYQTPREAWWEADLDPVYAFVRRELPADARLLCLHTNRGFYLDREYLADSFFDASQITDWLHSATSVTELRKRLAQRDITHVLIFPFKFGDPYHTTLLRLLQDQNQLQLVFRDDRFAVYALRPTSALSNVQRPRPAEQGSRSDRNSTLESGNG